MAEEIPLSGGNSAEGVVRVGNTVRKPPTPFDAATTALLTHLNEADIAGVPEPLGTDDQGRRILSWVSGSTTIPDTLWADERALISASALLRQIHDASIPLLKEKLTWAHTALDPAQHEVICHHDCAPYNMTFAADGTVVGMIDFDLAGPGPRLSDLAYLAWWMVPLGTEDPKMATATEADLSNGSKRLKSLCEAYHIVPGVDLLQMIAAVLSHMSDPDIARRMIGATATDKLTDQGHFAHWSRALLSYRTLQPRLAANLCLSSSG